MQVGDIVYSSNYGRVRRCKIIAFDHSTIPAPIICVFDKDSGFRTVDPEDLHPTKKQATAASLKERVRTLSIEFGELQAKFETLRKTMASCIESLKASEE